MSYEVGWRWWDPLTSDPLQQRAGLSPSETRLALAALESSGNVLQGHFNPGAMGDQEVDWCDRRLLARIHRLTLGRLRREIEPITAADFIRFLLRWQHVEPRSQLHGREGILQVIRQLQGLELPAPAWEEHVAACTDCPLRPGGLGKSLSCRRNNLGKVKTQCQSRGSSKQ